jgi:hypothetical protein
VKANTSVLASIAGLSEKMVDLRKFADITANTLLELGRLGPNNVGAANNSDYYFYQLKTLFSRPIRSALRTVAMAVAQIGERA